MFFIHVYVCPLLLLGYISSPRFIERTGAGISVLRLIPKRVRLDAYREIVVNDTALPHTFDGDGGLTRHFGEPDGVCYIVVGDAVPAVEVGFGMWGNDGLFARPVDFGQSLLSNLLKTVQRVSQYDAVVVIDITRSSHQQGVGVNLGKYRVFAGKARVVVKRLFQSGSEAPFRIEGV